MWIVSFLFETRAMRTKHLPPRPPSARPGHRLLVSSHLLDRRRAMVGREYPLSVQTSIAEIDVLFFLLAEPDGAAGVRGDPHRVSVLKVPVFRYEVEPASLRVSSGW